MKGLSIEDKKAIDVLRFPLAMLVIYIHVDLITTNQFSYITAESMSILWGG